ncbi:MAG: hypothetical protein EAZ92_15665 [Candidatus Kapaibacterium sp.]|nr:MAG: hypothetical protein EAZ92_15665 [Candidatus Kapabacteria bacterium]
MAHITSFTAQNFKRFEHFEMHNIGQFNLIVGDNNVGKTSVLEALLIDENPEIYKQRLLTVLFKFRQFTDVTDSYLSYFVCRNKPDWESGRTMCFVLGLPNETKTLRIKFKDKNQSTGSQPATSEFILDGVIHSISSSNSHYPEEYPTPYIPLFLAYEHKLTKLYSSYVGLATKLDDELVEHLKSIIPTIKGIIVNPYITYTSDSAALFISRTDTETALPLGFFGDGAIKLFRILIEIAVHRGKRLMIDEIDAGVHIQNFRGFWKTILRFATKLNVQLFMTTHNWECLEVFKKVLEEPEMEQFQVRARCFTLIDSPVTKRVEAVCSTFEQFETAIENGTELRGGAIV